ncbi:MAG: glycosyltransferase family 2 protein, partial [Planctomycetota bacterium]|nr:glycosyltransferase family 2 protein [Planctomycetota bacterium]
NYRTGPEVWECLASLAPQITEGIDVVVVDNDSPDDSADVIERAIAERGWSSWARLVRSGRNGGFAAGNNVAIREALFEDEGPEVLFLLNPDTIVPPGAIDMIRRQIAVHPNVGIFGVSMLNPTGGLNANAFRFPSILGELEQGARLGPLSKVLARWQVAPAPPQRETSCDWVSGAAMIVRRAVFQHVGLMDDGYFLYFEEVDLCLRARKAGFEILYLPGANIVHLEGAATGVGETGKADRTRTRKPSWWYDARRRYFVKHHGWFGLVLADILWGLGRLSLEVRSRIGLGGRTEGDPLFYAKDLLGGDLRALRDHLDGRDQVSAP